MAMALIVAAQNGHWEVVRVLGQRLFIGLAI